MWFGPPLEFWPKSINDLSTKEVITPLEWARAAMAVKSQVYTWGWWEFQSLGHKNSKLCSTLKNLRNFLDNLWRRNKNFASQIYRCHPVLYWTKGRTVTVIILDWYRSLNQLWRQSDDRSSSTLLTMQLKSGVCKAPRSHPLSLPLIISPLLRVGSLALLHIRSTLLDSERNTVSRKGTKHPSLKAWTTYTSAPISFLFYLQPPRQPTGRSRKWPVPAKSAGWIHQQQQPQTSPQAVALWVALNALLLTDNLGFPWPLLPLLLLLWKGWGWFLNGGAAFCVVAPYYMKDSKEASSYYHKGSNNYGVACNQSLGNNCSTKSFVQKWVRNNQTLSSIQMAKDWQPMRWELSLSSSSTLLLNVNRDVSLHLRRRLDQIVSPMC